VCRFKERTQTRRVENGMLWRFNLTAGTGVVGVLSLVASHVQGNVKQHTYAVTLQQETEGTTTAVGRRMNTSQCRHAINPLSASSYNIKHIF